MTAAARRAPCPEGGVEGVVLAFCAVLLGGDKRGAGLLSRRVDGRFHTRGCQIGMYIRPDYGPEGCSDRCASAREAIEAATAWLQANERPAVRQLVLDEVAG